MHGSREIGLGYRRALRLRDRDERHTWKRCIKAAQVEHVLPAMQRRERGMPRCREHWKMHEVGMEMQDVEAVRLAPDFIEHCHMVGQMASYPRIEPKRLLATR